MSKTPDKSTFLSLLLLSPQRRAK